MTLKDYKKVPGVSVIRPLRGVDNCLEECLISSFEMAYPKFEVIFCVPDETDAAIAVVNKLIARYPQVDAKLMIGKTLKIYLFYLKLINIYSFFHF